MHSQFAYSYSSRHNFFHIEFNPQGRNINTIMPTYQVKHITLKDNRRPMFSTMHENTISSDKKINNSLYSNKNANIVIF
jgi:hypothetical protein